MPKGKQPNPGIEIRGIGEGISESKLTQLGANKSGVPVARSNKELRTRGQVSVNMTFSMEIMQLSESAKKIDRVELLRDAFKRYLELCDQYGIPPTNMSAYSALGIDLKTAKLWAAGKAGRDKAELIRWINQFLAMSRQTNIDTGAMSPQVGMFLQKNFDGLSETPIEIAEERDLLGDKPSAEDIIDRYESLPDEE